MTPHTVMRAQHLALASLALALPTIPGCRTAQAQDQHTSERKIQLTIYKDDFALIREQRSEQMPKGRGRIQLSEVTNSLDPQSVLIELPGGKVVSTTYDMGVGQASTMLSRLAGKEVELMLPSDNGSQGNTISGILEPSQDGGFLLRSDDKLYVNPAGTIVAKAESGLATMPQLWAEVQSDAQGSQTLDLTYLSRGLRWSADYTARLGEDSMRLELWATVTNQTGVAFPSAEITFAAGSPNRAAVEADMRAKNARAGGPGAPGAMAAETAKMPMIRMDYQATGEIYTYKAPAAASVGVDQMNRVPMMEPVDVPIKRDYSVALPPMYGYSYGYGGGTSDRVNATLAISFKNDKPSSLGLPLPGGAMRFYSKEGEGAAYIGAASLRDLAKDESAHLTLSNVFDVSAQPRVVSSKRLDKRTVRRTVEVVVANRKASAVDVRLVQPTYGTVKLVTQNRRSKKLNESTYQWSVKVPAGAEEKLSFVVDARG